MTHRLAVLHDAMNAFAEASGDVERLLSIIARHTSEALGAGCSFLALDEEGTAFKAVAMHSPIPELAAYMPIGGTWPVESEQPPAPVLRAGKIRLLAPVPDAMLRARWPEPAEYEAVRRLGIPSMLIVPLRVHGSVIGGFTLFRFGADVPTFEEGEIELAQSLADHAAIALANARLRDRTQRELAARERLERRLRATSALAQELAAATSDYRRVIEVFTRRVGEHLDAMCLLRMVSADGRWMDSTASVYHADEAVAEAVRAAVRDRPVGLANGLHGRVATSGTAVLIPVTTPEQISAALPDYMRHLPSLLDARSVMVAPVSSRGKVIGVASLVRGPSAPAFTDDDLQFFEDAAGHASLAITNARWFVEAHRELVERERLAGRLRLLSELSREFAAGTGDTRALLQLVARRVAEVLGNGCTIRMLTEDRQALESPGVIYNEDLEELRYLAAVMAQQPQRLDEGLSGRVATTGETVLIPVVDPAALRARAGDQSAEVVERVGIRSILITALRANEQILGVLAAYRTRTTTPFSDEDRQLLEGVATHASLAIANSQLIERTRRLMTERVRTEEVLRRGFLEAAPDAVLIVDAAGAIQLVNTQTETLFGYDRSELVGMPIDALVPERFRGHHGAHRRGYLGAAVTRPMGAGLNLFALRKDGREFAAEISLSPIDTPEGTLVAAAVRDVTERRREMEERNRRMQEANRLKSEFLANMSHELRTPLNAVIGFAALLHSGKAGALAELHREYVGDILTSSRHLLQLINDVLDLSKIEAGRMDLRVEATDVARTASEVRDIIRGLAAERHVRLAIDVHPDVTQVRVDPRLLKQVLYNYLSNAIKFTPDGGRVTLRIAPEGAEAFRIDVEDTGIGIKPEDMRRLFVEFQQLDQGAAKKYPGTGLGLALTKRIVEAQGGRVQARSVPGSGSTFTAILPRTVEVKHDG